MDGMAYQGRLELTWTNKDKCLLALEDGSYEWVPPSDYRVAEVRLLQDVGTIGEVHPESERAKDNLLIHGDALNALTSLTGIPEFAREYVGKVRLAYIDPPFNTQQAFNQYNDALEHSVWLTMMRDRLKQIKTLLAPNGSVWVHCDDSEQHRLRCAMDEIFGPGNFVANIIWEKSYTRENRTDISTVHDYILVYAKERSIWSGQRNLLPPTEEQVKRYTNPDNDPRGPWKAVPAHAKAGPGRRASQFYEIRLPSGRVVSPPPGRCWMYTRERFEELVADNRVWFGRDGDAVPSIKHFLSEVQSGLVPVTIWKYQEVGTTGDAKTEVLAVLPDVPPFDTPKPERLIARIVHIASDPGDIVLDCFAGSGTTGVVAHKMRRRWVMVEWSAPTVFQYIIPRLRKVVDGTDRGGITEQASWQGGGGFRILKVAPSMFAVVSGRVVLADWATNGLLSEATAAQLGYEYDVDPPFCGKKGRKRLAVVDGLVNGDVVRLIVGSLPEDETVTICGTAVDPAAKDVLRSLRPGSMLRKIPQALLAQYRSRHLDRVIPMGIESSPQDQETPLERKA